MVVQHNLTAINANRYLGINHTKLGKSLEKLSSGFAINRAGDNAAGLAVSEKMRSQIGGMTQAVKNAQDSISMIQTYEGALTETDAILQRMKTLAVQSANGTYDQQTDRAAIELEYRQLCNELDDIACTDFNGLAVLTGKTEISAVINNTGVSGATVTGEAVKIETSSFGRVEVTTGVSLQVGSRTKDLKYYAFDYEKVFQTGDKVKSMGSLDSNLDCTSSGLGLRTGLESSAYNVSLGTQMSANQAIDKIDFAINKVSMIRATFGSIQNRLEHKIDNLNVTTENLTAAESRIRDTDMPLEMMNFTKNQILSQASQTMLAQANVLPQSVLALLQ